MASHWCDQLVDSGPPLTADNKVYWWSISGLLSVANDTLFYGSTGVPPSVANNKVDRWPTSGPLLGAFYGGSLMAANNKVYWWSISGPLLAANDKLFYWSTSGSPSLTNNLDSMQMLAQHWHIRRSDIGSHCWRNVFLVSGCYVGLTLASHW